MPEGLQSRATDPGRPPEAPPPTISVCRSCPGTSVFIEAGNTDGWIATDAVVELSR